jgi:bifunctional DNA-binding transcriptional regulator/antitoxin component of YhaV-PrlF toxin-antitoxin module
MRSQCLVYLLLASLACGQAAPPATPPAPPPAAGAPAEQTAAPAAPEKAPVVKPDDPVITLQGFCADATLQGDACKTVITRAQFEKVVDALQPGMAPPLRRQLANRYSQVLKMTAAAEKRGLDKQPSFEEKMHFVRMQVLAQALGTALQEDSAKVTDNEIADYYKKNEATYEQATFLRIFVPHAKQIVNPPAKPAPKTGAKTGATSGATAAAKTPAKPATPPPPTEAQKKAAEDAMTKLATTLQARAAKGEDFDKLQKEAYVAAGLPASATNTKVEKARRSTLPANHQAVMDLKEGEVSDVISDPNGGHYIYKLVSKETITLEAATPEIRKTLSSQRYRDTMQSFQKDVDLNDAYFGPVRGPGMPPPPRGARPTPDPD